MRFGVKGGAEEGCRYIDVLKLFCPLTNVGYTKSLVLHPASTTHGQMNKQELLAAGVMQEMIRLSIGLEDAEDLKAVFSSDLRQA